MFLFNPSIVGNTADDEDEDGADFDLGIRETEGEDDGVKVIYWLIILEKKDRIS